MPEKTNSNYESLCKMYGAQAELYVRANLESLKGASFRDPCLVNKDAEAELVEVVTALDDPALKDEMVTKIAMYGIKNCSYAYGSGTRYENYRTPAINAQVFLRTLLDFLNPHQCLLLAQYFMKCKAEANQKEQSR